MLQQVQKGPVVLEEHSQPAAVLVSIEEWSKQAEELSHLRRILIADLRSKEMEEDASHRIPFTLEALRKQGLLDA